MLSIFDFGVKQKIIASFDKFYYKAKPKFNKFLRFFRLCSWLWKCTLNKKIKKNSKLLFNRFALAYSKFEYDKKKSKNISMTDLGIISKMAHLRFTVWFKKISHLFFIKRGFRAKKRYKKLFFKFRDKVISRKLKNLEIYFNSFNSFVEKSELKFKKINYLIDKPCL